MLTTIIVVAALAFAGYAVVSYYKSTDSTKSVPARVWASITLAGAALATAAANYWTGTFP